MRNLTHLILALIFLTVSSTLSAQGFEIKGKITDSKTGEPMIGVNITIVGDVHGTVSGFDGKFLLKSKKTPPFTLHFSFVGYESLDIGVTASNTFLDISMSEQYLLGQEIVVSVAVWKKVYYDRP